MPRRNPPPRRLWLKVRVLKVPPGTKRSDIVATMEEAILDGEYDLPRGWDIQIEWRNKEDAEMRTDEFSHAMRESAASSAGFNSAVLAYLNSQRSSRRRRGQA